MRTEDVDDEMAGEGDVNDFFDDEAEEVEDEDTEMDNSRDDDLSSLRRRISLAIPTYPTAEMGLTPERMWQMS